MVILLITFKDGFDVFVEIASMGHHGQDYFFAACTLYTSTLHVFQLGSGNWNLHKTLKLRETGYQTNFVKYDFGAIWTSGDDMRINRIMKEELIN